MAMRFAAQWRLEVRILVQARYGNLGSVFEILLPTIANGGGVTGPGGTVVPVLVVPTVSPRADIVMALAIVDLCPAYVGGYPKGDPGAT